MPRLEDKIFRYSNEDSLSKALKAFCKSNGYGNVKSHDFRVSMATELYGKGNEVEKIRVFLQHSSQAVTLKYIKFAGYKLR